MKINIESDVHDIVDRLKEIDDGYFILYDTEKCVYELHNSNQSNTFCLTISNENIDARIMDMVYATSIKNIDNIIDDIDRNNENINNECKRAARDVADYEAREIYKFASNSSKDMSEKDLMEEGGRWL